MENLDGMTQGELLEIWAKSNSVRPVSFARQMFPNRPKGYVIAAKDVGNYASNKATAIGCRETGRIHAALMYERICERIYAKLPEYARW